MPGPPESLEAAALRLEREAPGYLELVRRRAADLGMPKTPEARARRMVERVMQAAPVNADAPVASDRPHVSLVKRGVASLVRFYLLHLTGQVATLGDSTALMGEAICDYVASLEAQLTDLRERMARLEQANGAP